MYNADHTTFKCVKWERERIEVRDSLGVRLTKGNFFETIMKDRESWKTVEVMIGKIMKAKKDHERRWYG